LLRVCKDEILDYCNRASLTFVTDSTNEEPVCARNRLRLDVIPVLRELWPKGADAAARCAASLAEDEALLSQMAREFIEKEGETLSCASLAALPSPIFARVMHALLPMPPEATHIEALATLVREARPHASLSLPAATVRVENGKCYIEGTDTPDNTPYQVPLAFGETHFPYGVAILTHGIVSIDEKMAKAFPHTARITFCQDAVRGTLSLRPRKAGERIFSGGNHKLIRKLPCMSRYPLALRARMPLLCDDDGVIAVPTGPMRDGATKRADTTLILLFR
jgi:tRNA(Ile)-lysidine synthase